MISPFRPAIDGDVVPDAVVPCVAAGSGGEVDLLAGTTRDELTFAMQPLGMLERVDDWWAAQALAAFGVTDDDLDVYRKVSRPGASRAELLMAAWTDSAFRIPTIRPLDAHAGHAGRTYAYEFAWQCPTVSGMGATHALELPFVNDRLAETRAALVPDEDLLGDAPPQALADAMRRAWVAFATDGAPGWPAYDIERRTTMRFDTVSEPVGDPGGAERELWSGRR